MNYVASALEDVCVNKTKLSREMHRIQRRPNRSRLRIGASLFVASLALFPVPAHAFVAAGDRVFPATLILPQIAPTDETYIQGATPFSGVTPIPLNTRRTDVIGLFGKTLTESLGIRVRDVYSRLDPVDASSRYGWQTLTATAQYMAVLDGPHEFLFSVGVDRQFSGTGNGFVGLGEEEIEGDDLRSSLVEHSERAGEEGARERPSAEAFKAAVVDEDHHHFRPWWADPAQAEPQIERCRLEPADERIIGQDSEHQHHEGRADQRHTGRAHAPRQSHGVLS
jgi:hypothetical protein